MNKQQLLNLLEKQAQQPNTKTTRKDIIKVVANLVKEHIKDNATIEGINSTRSNKGVNLGEVVEIIIKALYRNKLVKSAKDYDLNAKGEKVEVKFTTSDAYAHPVNQNAIVDYYLIVAYTKALGGQIFKIPFAEKQNIKVNKQGRVITNQLAKYIDNNLTQKVFA